MLSGARWRNANGIQNAGSDTATSLGAVITAHASNATKGNYTQLIASTGKEAFGLMLSLRAASAQRFSVDIAIGAAASEIIILADLILSGDGTGELYTIFIPLYIPAGVRLSSRCSSSLGSSTLRLHALVLQGNDVCFGRATHYGFDLTNTRGVLTTAHATIHTKGNYSTIIASTTSPIRALYIMVSPGTVSASSLLLDIAIGAAASEVVVIANISTRHSSTTRAYPSMIGPFPVDIPSGTRISARVQSSVTVTDIGVSVLGLD